LKLNDSYILTQYSFRFIVNQNVIISSLLLSIYPFIRRAEAITSLKLVLIGIYAPDERTRLSGMRIKGDRRLIYKDPSQKQTCSWSYPLEGTDVCSDVISIPLNGPSVQKIKISTDNFLTLCEVKVFGGIEFILLFPDI